MPTRSAIRLALAGLGFWLACPTAQAQSLLDAAPVSANTARMAYMKEPLSFFKSQRLICFNTVETVPRGELQTRVAHRFGDAATKGTTYHTMFGLDQATDIWLGVDYGITNSLQVGLARTRGAGPLGQLWSLSGKLRLPGDRIGNVPIRMAIAGNATYSTQVRDPFINDSLTNEPFARRGSYMAQFLFAIAPKGRFVFQIAPTYVWRNYVDVNDANGLLALPISGRFKVTKRFSLTAEYSPLLNASSSESRGGRVFWKGKNGSWYAPLMLAAELETGGHVFQISLSNSRGMLENDLIPYSGSQWRDGGFRMGFAIMRGFQVKK